VSDDAVVGAQTMSYRFTAQTNAAGSGNSSETWYRHQSPFQGLLYKQFCRTSSPTQQQAANRNPDALDHPYFIQTASTSNPSAICHEQVFNYDALTTVSGATRIQVAASFEDVRRTDGTYQHAQTNYTYTARGQVRYEDQYGEQGTPDDDRYIEREYHNPSFPDLVTVENVRDTSGAFVAKTSYHYVPGTRLLGAEERWLLEESRPLTTTYTYDARGLLTAVSDPLGHTTRYEYDGLGHRTRLIRPDGVATAYEYDAGGRLSVVTEHHRPGLPSDGQTNVRTTFIYDANGNLLSVIDANGHTQRYTYDALNRQITSSDALSQTQRLFYTPRGELDYTIDALGRTTDYTYDAIGRLTTIDYPSGTADVSYQYDAAGNVLTMTDGLGTRGLYMDRATELESDQISKLLGMEFTNESVFVIVSEEKRYYIVAVNYTVQENTLDIFDISIQESNT
jgi:YD repeat-containing protein